MDSGSHVRPFGGAAAGFTVRVEDARSYDAVFAPGLLKDYGRLVRPLVEGAVVVLTDRRVRRLFGDALAASFAAEGIEPGWIEIAEGERSKSLPVFGKTLQRLAEAQFDRRGLLVCFGGGVVSDLGGFVASAYMRGVRYANCATSLLAQVDACVGGKVAVNTDKAKNLVGAFWHPVHVAADTSLHARLSHRDYRSGLAEAIKVGIIADPALFARFETDRARLAARDPQALAEIVRRAAEVKMELISRDPYERDLRRPLNFGHTIGHAVETEFGYRKIRHGEAVGIGMGVATAIARRRGTVDAATADRIFAVLAAYDLLGFSEPLRPDSIVAHVRYVRLIRGKRLHFVLPRAIGDVEITEEMRDEELVLGFEDYALAVAERAS